jgi:hypothetical protein
MKNPFTMHGEKQVCCHRGAIYRCFGSPSALIRDVLQKGPLFRLDSGLSEHLHGTHTVLYDPSEK